MARLGKGVTVLDCIRVNPYGPVFRCHSFRMAKLKFPETFATFQLRFPDLLNSSHHHPSILSRTSRFFIAIFHLTPQTLSDSVIKYMLTR